MELTRENVGVAAGNTMLQAEINQLKDLYEHVCKMSGIGAWEIDAATMKLEWSKQLRVLFGHTQQSTPDINDMLSLFEGDVRKQLSEAINNAVNNSTPFSIILKQVTSAGKQLWLKAVGQPMVKSGKTVKLYGIFQDVTETVTNKEQLKELEENNDMLQWYISKFPPVS